MPKEERKIWRQTHDYNVISINGDYEELRKTNKQKSKKKIKNNN